MGSIRPLVLIQSYRILLSASSTTVYLMHAETKLGAPTINFNSDISKCLGGQPGDARTKYWQWSAVSRSEENRVTLSYIWLLSCYFVLGKARSYSRPPRHSSLMRTFFPPPKIQRERSSIIRYWRKQFRITPDWVSIWRCDEKSRISDCSANNSLCFGNK